MSAVVAAGPLAPGEGVIASAPANIAFIKYWGARDLERALPYHPSLSMTLETCRSITRVEILEPGADDDQILLVPTEGGEAAPAPEAFRSRIAAHLERLRRRAGTFPRLSVTTRNSFPAAAGMASSASGFAALTVAAGRALGLPSEPEELSVLARASGSGSAARSVMGGYVEWPRDRSGRLDPGAPAEVVAPADHWALADLVALVETGAKKVSSLDGPRRAETSPHFSRRLEEVPQRLAATRAAVLNRDLPSLGEILEEDAVELHLVAMSSRPPIFYWRPGTLAVMAAVRELRHQGTLAYSTTDAGANVHVICRLEDANTVADALESVPGVGDVLRDRVGEGPRFHDDDQELFAP